MQYSSNMQILKNSDIVRGHAGQRVITARPIGKGFIAGYYYGSFAYVHLSSRGCCSRAYGESIMKLTKELFVKWVNRLSEKLSHKNMEKHDEWLLPAPVCAMRYVNDERFLPEDETPLC